MVPRNAAAYRDVLVGKGAQRSPRFPASLPNYNTKERTR
ncbi:hypothetical protein M2412_001126 [Stenotrophomonas rhizophila]|uniref:Uncharacterized protein n=1 Tax=Stenotrophomonas rhizophila TaxID=216778 RepID=A0AAW5PG83_9GAMM|nr:hypothetical protein [Stenotrophomonas rhizophila]